jgi:hypothetical protein
MIGSVPSSQIASNLTVRRVPGAELRVPARQICRSRQDSGSDLFFSRVRHRGVQIYPVERHAMGLCGSSANLYADDGYHGSRRHAHMPALNWDLATAGYTVIGANWRTASPLGRGNSLASSETNGINERSRHL